MEKQDQIRAFFQRVGTIDTEEQLYDLKEEIFEVLRLWELERPLYYWPKQIKEALCQLSFQLTEIEMLILGRH